CLIKFAPFCQGACPRKDGCDRICRCRVAFKVLIIMSNNSTMCSLELEFPVRRYKHRCHEAEASEAGRHHIRHYIAVVVHTCPEHSAIGLYHLGNGVIDEKIAVLNTRLP